MDIQDLLNAVTEWARGDSRVAGVVLVGSHARGAARPDSDLDLVLLCSNPDELLADTAWVTRFGSVVSRENENYGQVTSVRVFYESGPEVEFGVADMTWGSVPLDVGTKRVLEEGARVLWDESGLLHRALRSLRKADALHPTPYSDLNAVLRRLVDGIRSIVADDFIGAYLQGSFAVGGFDVHSDVDFVVVSREELRRERVDALQVWHGRVYDSDCEWARHLEGSYFPREVLARPEGRGRKLWYLDNGAKSLVLSSHCNTLVVRWILREYGIALAGPPARGLIDPFPVEALRQEIESTMRDWGAEILAHPGRFENRFYQTFIVLSYAKMLHDLRTGRIGSKREGAEWAKGVLDPSWADLIDRAWGGRPNPAKSVREPPDADDFRRTLEFVDYVIGEIAP